MLYKQLYIIYKKKYNETSIGEKWFVDKYIKLRNEKLATVLYSDGIYYTHMHIYIYMWKKTRWYT